MYSQEEGFERQDTRAVSSALSSLHSTQGTSRDSGTGLQTKQRRQPDQHLMKKGSGKPGSLESIKVGVTHHHKSTASPLAGDTHNLSPQVTSEQEQSDGKPTDSRGKRALRPARSCNIDRDAAKSSKGSRGNYFSLSKPANTGSGRYPKSCSECCRTCPSEESFRSKADDRIDSHLTMQFGTGNGSMRSGPLTSPFTLRERPHYALLSPGSICLDPAMSTDAAMFTGTHLEKEGFSSYSAPLNPAVAAQFLPSSDSPRLTRHSVSINRPAASGSIPRSNSPTNLDSPSARGRIAPDGAKQPLSLRARQQQFTDGKALLAYVSPRGPAPPSGFVASDGNSHSGVFSLPPPPLGDSVSVIEAPFLFRKLKRTHKSKAKNELLDKVHGKA